MSADEILLAVILLVITLTLVKRFRRTPRRIPVFEWPFDKKTNFEFIQEHLKNNSLPKIYKSKILGLPIGPIIITDYELMKKVFGSAKVSDRLHNDRLELEERLIRKDYGLEKLFREATGDMDLVEGLYGVGNGPYSDSFRKLRSNWHHAVLKLQGTDKLHESVKDNARQLCAQLSAVDGAPLDPLPYLLNGSINVLTTFLLGVHYKLGDEKFQTVSKMTKDLLRNLMGYVQAKMTASITPKWLIKMRCFRKLKMRVFPKYRDMCELLYGKFQPYIFSYIKDHKKGLDEENFRDYMDFLLDLTRTDSSVGFHTIGFTLVSLYIGGTDTIANTMRWLLIQLALRPALQERLYDELQSVKSEKGSFEQKDCHLLSSVMLENRRCFPVADSLPHQVAEDVEIEGYRFKKGDFFLGSLASIMRNPENFENPDEFLPDRFIKNREFVHDYKVCSFGVGKRNCIGQQIAKTENFYFAAEIILNFTLQFEEGAPLPKIDKNMSSVLAPEPFKLKFLHREN